MNLWNKDRDAQRGSAAVEAAMIMLWVLPLFIGMIEVGGMFWAWVTTVRAAEHGARYAATGQGEVEHNRLYEIKAEAVRYLQQLPETDSDVDVRSWDGAAPTGAGYSDDPGKPCDMVQVEVTYYYRPMTPLVGRFFPSEIPISARDRKINEPWTSCE